MVAKSSDIKKILADEARKAARAHARGEIRYKRVGRPPKPSGERGQVYSIRIPVERLEELRLIARRAGEQPAVLARDWILQRLDEEASARVVGLPRKEKASRKVTAVPQRKSAARRASKAAKASVRKAAPARKTSSKGSGRK